MQERCVAKKALETTDVNIVRFNQRHQLLPIVWSLSMDTFPSAYPTFPSREAALSIRCHSTRLVHRADMRHRRAGRRDVQ